MTVRPLFACLLACSIGALGQTNTDPLRITFTNKSGVRLNVEVVRFDATNVIWREGASCGRLKTSDLPLLERRRLGFDLDKASEMDRLDREIAKLEKTLAAYNDSVARFTENLNKEKNRLLKQSPAVKLAGEVFQVTREGLLVFPSNGSEPVLLMDYTNNVVAGERVAVTAYRVGFSDPLDVGRSTRAVMKYTCDFDAFWNRSIQAMKAVADSLNPPPSHEALETNLSWATSRLSELRIERQELLQKK